MRLSERNRALIEREFSPTTAARAAGSEGGALFSNTMLDRLLDAARKEGGPVGGLPADEHFRAVLWEIAGAGSPAKMQQLALDELARGVRPHGKEGRRA